MVNSVEKEQQCRLCEHACEMQEISEAACGVFQAFLSIPVELERYDYEPHDGMSLLDTMNAGCLDKSAQDCQGWIRHAGVLQREH